MSDSHQPDKVVGPPFDAADADIILRSSDGADLRTYKFLLSFASPVFRTMLSLPQPIDEVPTSSSTFPIIPMPEDRHTLEKLLLHCYPGSSISLHSLDDIKLVLDAAAKYDMEFVLENIKKWMVTSTLFKNNPLAFYVLSCVRGFKVEARLSASRALEVIEREPNHFIPELEEISAGTYYRLIKYHAQCGAAARDVMQNLQWIPMAERLIINTNWPGCEHCRDLKVPLFGGGMYSLPTWLKTYLDGLGEELYRRPCASTVMKTESFNAALIKGASCEVCNNTLATKLSRMRDKFAARVATVISQVKLEFS
ncbi:hypothetical protein BJ138DRAFT_1123916 [Hygrophoropsis aurantiaca]|uniref:Uncharacterized protein n=1 Tax=Hygrophoropsis aurantiaca TaxID=72124 RepID=A0ACB8ALQ6_9AGAM|nr:hypothetical protein BJ138DRAFT_1123916 [Hygrophoropsis aurantiaca]